jgi:cardiolipin synthase
MVVDDVVYAGSSNLDPRSLRINYEMMIRFQNRAMADAAGLRFGGDGAP